MCHKRLIFGLQYENTFYDILLDFLYFTAFSAFFYNPLISSSVIFPSAEGLICNTLNKTLWNVSVTKWTVQ
jgi:hypothetical protein